MNIITETFRNKVLEGANKVLYQSDTKGQLDLYFKVVDENNDFGVVKKEMSDIFFSLLTEHGVNNHLISSIGVREQKVVALDMLPFVVTVNAFVAESIAAKFSMPYGMRLNSYLIEIKVQNGEGKMCNVSKEHILNFGWLDSDSLEFICKQSLRTFDILSGFFRALDLILFSVDLRFGKRYKEDGELFDCMIGDEMTLKNLNLKLNHHEFNNDSKIYLYLAERLGLLK